MKKDKILNSRRAFLTFARAKDETPSADNEMTPEESLKIPSQKVKMLTPDGQLVEIDKSVLEGSNKQKASNKDIMRWSNNQSFKNT